MLFERNWGLKTVYIYIYIYMRIYTYMHHGCWGLSPSQLGIWIFFKAIEPGFLALVGELGLTNLAIIHSPICVVSSVSVVLSQRPHARVLPSRRVLPTYETLAWTLRMLPGTLAGTWHHIVLKSCRRISCRISENSNPESPI